MANRYNNNTLCRKTLHVVNELDQRPYFGYDQGILTLNASGQFLAYFALVDYPTIQSKTFVIDVPAPIVRVRFTEQISVFIVVSGAQTNVDVLLEGTYDLSVVVVLGEAADFTTFTVQDKRVSFQFSIEENLISTDATITITASEINSVDPFSVSRTIGFVILDITSVDD